MEEKTLKVNRKHYQFLHRADGTRINILFGGAGSGKSWSVAQYLLMEKFYKEKEIGILVIRKTLPALKASAYVLMINILTKYELPYKHNKTDMIVTHDSNFIMFRSLDDIEKIKSIEGINYVWIEEATEITKFELLQLNIRARAQNINKAINRIFCTFNPVDVRSFFKEMTDNPPEGVAVHHSTYRDNAFLDPEYIKELELLIAHDKTYYLIYNQGQWASPGNIVYTNWKVTHFWPKKFDWVGYGLDFGFNAPTALIEIGSKDTIIYERELLYETKLTNQRLIERMSTLIPQEYRGSFILADSAEPDRIEEIFNAGFNIVGVTKTKNSIKLGIDRVKRLDIRILSSSTNLIMEKQSYKWKEDKYGNVLDEVVPYKDHLMDAERYYLGTVQDTEVSVVEIGNYDLDSAFSLAG